MPAPLPDETERVSWRIYTADVELLSALHPNVSAYMREVVKIICDRHRARLAGQRSGAGDTISSRPPA